MAIAQNVFKTITHVSTANPVGIYTAPVGYTGVVLLAQATNIGSQTHSVSLSHQRTVAGIAVTTEILKDFPIAASDSANLVGGKLVLESNDSLLFASNGTSDVKFLGSILETLK